MTTYQEKLKDPRWQKKRLEIFKRDNWTCHNCGATDKTLCVHHRIYFPKRDPWEYEDHFLMTVCEDCHLNKEEMRHWNVYDFNILQLHTILIFKKDIIKFKYAQKNNVFNGEITDFISQAYSYCTDQDKGKYTERFVENLKNKMGCE